jgi:hypothetical protein
MEPVWDLFLQSVLHDATCSQNLLSVGTVFSVFILQKCVNFCWVTYCEQEVTNNMSQKN